MDNDTSFESHASVDFDNDITNYLSIDEMQQYVFDLLIDYNTNKMNGDRDCIDPLNMPVVIELNNGAKFTVPDEIVDLAKNKFYTMMNRKDVEDIQDNRFEGFYGGPQRKTCSKPKKVAICIVCAIIIALMVYLIYKNCSSEDDYGFQWRSIPDF